MCLRVGEWDFVHHDISRCIQTCSTKMCFLHIQAIGVLWGAVAEGTGFLQHRADRLCQGLSRKAVLSSKVLLGSDHAGKGWGKAKPSKSDVSPPRFSQNFSHCASETTRHAVFLHGENCTGLAGRCEHGLHIEGSHRMHAKHACLHARDTKLFGNMICRFQHPSRGNQREIIPVANLDCLSQMQINGAAVNVWLPCAPQPQIARPRVRSDRVRRCCRFQGIPGSDNCHSRQGPKNRQILRGMMSHAQSAVSKTSAHGDDLHVRPVIAERRFGSAPGSAEWESWRSNK